MTTKQEQLEFR